MSDTQAAPAAAIVVAASFTIEPLLPGLNLVLDEAGLTLRAKTAPYSQVFQELLSPTGVLAANTGGVNVILLRLEDFIRDVGDPNRAHIVVQTIARDLSAALEQYVRQARSPTILSTLAPSPYLAAKLQPDVRAATSAVVRYAQQLRGVYLLPDDGITGLCTDDRYDDLRDELAHIPFTEEFYAAMALAVGRYVHALLVPPRKVLVLDCDNTLWRGVIGEDGVDGITIPDALREVQRFAVEVQSRGTLVCLASKNAERDVLDVLETRPDMVLRHENIVAHRINWLPKADNIASLARELNLGLDSFVFVDDNPIECAQVRAALPEVITLQLPADGEIVLFLAHLWVFDKLTVTNEDSRRTNMYREEVARRRSEATTTNIEEFIASLGIVIDIDVPSDDEWSRLAQLTQRTNQFNFTTIRRAETEMRSYQANGSLILRVTVQDRFGDYGLVGIIVANPTPTALAVDTLLLSCRVLGRGVEHAMLRRLGEIAAQYQLPDVELPYLPTTRNEPARAFADSVAAAYQVEERGRTIYRIPAAYARGIVHRPGYDPAAVIEARKSDQLRTVTKSWGPNRSECYSRIAQTLTSGRAVINAVHTKYSRRRTLPGALEPPAGDAECKLTALWRYVLNMKELGVTDDYFALGGTSLEAVRMFAEITRQFGVKLPLTTILDAPTVRSLANRIEPHNTTPSEILMELKKGGTRNLFLVHDGDGETLLYRNVARHLPQDLAVFGIGPRRLPRVPLAHTRIEDMARCYLEAVRRTQPHGPYSLGGLCAGGVIAYEMASQLTDVGECVQLVAILDAAKPGTPKQAGRIAKLRVRRVEEMFAGIRRVQRQPLMRAYLILKSGTHKLLRLITWEFRSRARRLTVWLRFRLLHTLLSRNLPWPLFLPQLSVRDIYDSAEAHYVPKMLDDAGVLLVRAQSGEADDTPYREIYGVDTFGWDTIVPHIEVIDASGGHSSMLQEPFAEPLAATLALKLTDGTERLPIKTTA